MFRSILAGTAALAAISLAACSSGGSGGAASGGPGTTVKSSSVAHSPAPAGSQPNAWCAEIDNSAATMLNGRPDPTAPLTAQEKQTVQRYVADAPGGIRSDVQTIADYEFAEADGKTSDPSANHIFTATTHVMQWLQTNCPSLFHKLNPGVDVSAAPSGGSS